jgi:hypothetical protein
MHRFGGAMRSELVDTLFSEQMKSRLLELEFKEKVFNKIFGESRMGDMDSAEIYQRAKELRMICGEPFNLEDDSFEVVDRYRRSCSGERDIDFDRRIVITKNNDDKVYKDEMSWRCIDSYAVFKPCTGRWKIDFNREILYRSSDSLVDSDIVSIGRAPIQIHQILTEFCYVRYPHQKTYTYVGKKLDLWEGEINEDVFAKYTVLTDEEVKAYDHDAKPFNRTFGKSEKKLRDLDDEKDVKTENKVIPPTDVYETKVTITQEKDGTFTTIKRVKIDKAEQLKEFQRAEQKRIAEFTKSREDDHVQMEMRKRMDELMDADIRNEHKEEMLLEQIAVDTAIEEKQKKNIVEKEKEETKIEQIPIKTKTPAELFKEMVKQKIADSKPEEEDWGKVDQNWSAVVSKTTARFNNPKGL